MSGLQLQHISSSQNEKLQKPSESWSFVAISRSRVESQPHFTCSKISSAWVSFKTWQLQQTFCTIAAGRRKKAAKISEKSSSERTFKALTRVLKISSHSGMSRLIATWLDSNPDLRFEHVPFYNQEHFLKIKFKKHLKSTTDYNCGNNWERINQLSELE